MNILKMNRQVINAIVARLHLACQHVNQTTSCLGIVRLLQKPRDVHLILQILNYTLLLSFAIAQKDEDFA